MRKKRESYTVYETIRNHEDIMDEQGSWIKSKADEVNGRRLMKITRAGALWNTIKHRCLAGGAQQRAYPNYVGCTLAFSSFQDFANWCQTQYGYWTLDSRGKYWNIDKDILVPGNKTYSEETCIFVPEFVNAAFRSGSDRGLHRGVYHDKSASTFTMVCIVDGSRIVTRHRTEVEAHRNWQVQKLKELNRISAVESLGEVLRGALRKRIDILQEELDSGIITNWCE